LWREVLCWEVEEVVIGGWRWRSMLMMEAVWC
jgi:hypothetical protein